MIGAVKSFLRIFGHALTKSVHERMDHVDHAIDLIIDQNNRMARSQTAVLQSSIHMVNTLNRLEGDLHAVKQKILRLSAKGELEEAIEKTLDDVAELKDAATNQVAALGEGGADAADE